MPRALRLINEALYARIHALTDWLELHLNLLSLSFVPFLPCSHMIIIHATCIPKFSVDTQLSSQHRKGKRPTMSLFTLAIPRVPVAAPVAWTLVWTGSVCLIERD